VAAARRTREQWRRLVAQFEKSGMTHAAFARSKAVNLASLRAWIYKLRREARSPRFVEVAPRRRSAALTPKAVVVVGDARFEFDERPPAEYLAALLRVVGKAQR
jgi:hypothetical protein